MAGAVQSVYAVADETIYTWTDQAALTNYGDIPPDDELQNNAVKVLNMQQGVTQKLEFPNRAIVDPNNPANKANVTGSGTSATNPAIPSAAVTPAAPPRIVGQSNPPPVPPKAPATDASKPNAPTMIASGRTDPVKDAIEEKKVIEQEAKLEEDAKSARRVAMDKRKQEMQALAERVRNGAASRQEIAALMTYRQTATFAEARSAMARPKATMARKVELTE